MEVVERLDTLLASCDECRMSSFDGQRLVIIGDFDLTYHHQFEAEFRGVAYLQCPTHFFADGFRLATAQECSQLNLADYADEGEHFFCFESDSHAFFIVAHNLELREGFVLHYEPKE